MALGWKLPVLDAVAIWDTCLLENILRPRIPGTALIPYRYDLFPKIMIQQREKVILGGGCFWCIEAFFKELKGVESVVSGYAGGTLQNPTYEQVSTGKTGHAEVVEVTFDPAVLPYPQLMDVFFAAHDPTTLNRQGNDIGTQYRSVIFYTTEEQKSQTEQKIKELTHENVFDNAIVTQVLPFVHFYPAEDYHQDYFKKNPNQPYCSLLIGPKLHKLRTQFAYLLQNQD